MIIADRVAIFVDSVYSNIYVNSGTTLFLASIMYSIQIYMDFSGCVDIALGAAEIFGINLTSNFKQPYFANSINDFWRRWHITLSSWFRDYVYIPLGGNRKGIVRRWLNVLIVFIISGIWHGVGFNFFIWGLLHGVYQVIGYLLTGTKERLINLFRFEKERKAFLLSECVITFLLVNAAWVFFRISDINEAIYVIWKSLSNWEIWNLWDGTLNNYGVSANQWHVVLIFLLIAIIVEILHEKNIKIREVIAGQFVLVRWAIFIVAFFSIVIFGVYGIGYNANSFIYMNF